MRILRIVPLTTARTRCRFGFQRRFVKLWACEIRCPKRGPFPHISHIFAIVPLALTIWFHQYAHPSKLDCIDEAEYRVMRHLYSIEPAVLSNFIDAPEDETTSQKVDLMIHCGFLVGTKHYLRGRDMLEKVVS